MRTSNSFLDVCFTNPSACNECTNRSTSASFNRSKSIFPPSVRMSGKRRSSACRSRRSSWTGAGRLRVDRDRDAGFDRLDLRAALLPGEIQVVGLLQIEPQLRAGAQPAPQP